MNSQSRANHQSTFKSKPKAVALIMVLSMLSLLTLLILGVFSASQTESSASNRFTSQVKSLQLSEAALNIVLNQISKATSEKQVAWASQPGAIRQWNQSGSFKSIYKLYSSQKMVETTSEANLIQDLPPANWAADAAKWTDLNQPAFTVEDGASKIHFPIIDPRVSSPAGSGPNHQPIEGFSYTPGGDVGAVAATSPEDTNARLPMPVRWIYVLQDGTIGTLNESNVFVGSKPATHDNPIVGRVAFWTDDETSKINLNTASEPVPWDVPRYTSSDEVIYAKNGPTDREYQRFPGHPAMTSVGTVLFPGTNLQPDLVTSSTSLDQIISNKRNVYTSHLEPLYQSLPRIHPGGSEGGTRDMHSTFPSRKATEITPPSGYPTRLLSSTEEYLFLPNRTRISSNLMTPEKLGRLRPFLTTSNASPELTLFNTPRVAIWPVSFNASNRTSFDNFFAFCSQSGGKPFYFQRHNSENTQFDWSNIPRNQQVYQYLQSLTSEVIPGFGGRFSEKWGADRDQILTEIFDYIRSSNLEELYLPAGAERFSFEKTDPQGRQYRGQVVPIQINDTQGFGRFVSISEAALQFICCADATIPESNALDNPTLGNVLLTGNQKRLQAAFLFEPYIAMHGNSPLRERVWMRVRGLQNLKIGDEYPWKNRSDIWRDGYQCHGWGNYGRYWGGTGGYRAYADAFVGEPFTIPNGAPGSTMSFTGGEVTLEVYAADLVNGTGDNRTLIQTIVLNFPSAEFPIPQLKMTGTPGDVDANGVTEKEFWWSFNKNVRSKGSRQDKRGAHGYFSWKPSTNPSWVSINATHPEGERGGAFIAREDVVRSLVPYHGDYRHVAAQKNVNMAPGTSHRVFMPHYHYFNVNHRVDHLLRLNAGPHLVYNFSNGNMDAPAEARPTQIQNVPYHFSKYPDYPRGYALSSSNAVLSQNVTTRDFDNGISIVSDGAYINKPDEGNNYRVRDNAGAYKLFDEFSPYFDDQAANFASFGTGYYSPNRLMTSPGTFGSLPTGVKRGRPWETLLFRPQAGHVGATSPMDHLIMDLFWMPIVEPYAISEPFSTNGKVNLNSAIAPFNYIKRQTALHALFKGETIAAVPNDEAKRYKNYDHEYNSSYQVDKAGILSRSYRKKIDPVATLQQWDEKFNSNTLFKSASQICEMHLVPQGASLNSMKDGSFWNSHLPTGENARERPYANLYNRITTRSNTYTVHFRVQTIKKARSVNPDQIDLTKDLVLSDYRGESLIERHIDPNDDNLRKAEYDFAPNPFAANIKSLTDLYQLRIVSTRRFSY